MSVARADLIRASSCHVIVRYGVHRNLTPDAHRAALAVEHGLATSRITGDPLSRTVHRLRSSARDFFITRSRAFAFSGRGQVQWGISAERGRWSHRRLVSRLYRSMY